MQFARDGEVTEQTRHVIDRQAHHMSRLLDDLLDVSRVTQGKIEMRRDVVDLRRAAEDAVDAVRPIVEARQQILSVDLPGEPVWVEGDQDRLQQMQVNLLTNASKYNSHGRRIWLSLHTDGGNAVLRVKDEGQGIPADEQEAVFDLFVQSPSTIGRADGGMGVGLTLVRSIVEKHGGRVTVQSDGVGKGSEFSVNIPLTAKRLPPSQPRRESGMPPNTRILIVEDNRDARETLKMLLEFDGFEVSTAPDGLAGFQAILRERPEIALVDIGLPEMNGLELAKGVRSDAANDGVLLIAVTGYGQPSDREAILKAGFDAHLVKPIDTDELTRILEERFPRQSTSK